MSPAITNEQSMASALTVVTESLVAHSDFYLRRFIVDAADETLCEGWRLQLFTTEVSTSFMAARLTNAYVYLYRIGKVVNRQQLHDRLCAMVRSGKGQEVEDYFTAEQNWDQTLRSIDDLLHGDMFQYGDRCPLQLFGSIKMQSIVDADVEKTTVSLLLSDTPFSLFIVSNDLHLPENRRYVQQLIEIDLHSIGCQLYLVCSSRRRAVATKHHWPNLRVLIDDERELIRSMEFKLSTWNACRTAKLHSMARSTMQCNDVSDLRPLADGAPLEIYQLGGVMLVESSGWLRFYRKACSSTDWPGVSQLLDEIPNGTSLLVQAAKRQDHADDDDQDSVYSVQSDDDWSSPTEDEVDDNQRVESVEFRRQRAVVLTRLKVESMMCCRLL